MLRVIALLGLCCFTAAAPAAAPPALPATTPAPRPLAVREVFDLRYAPGGGRRHTLDVFCPIGPAGRKYPVVLFVHGGTWMVGDKNFFGIYRGVGRYLASQGMVAVLCNYRLSPLVRHPEHARDVAAAFAWTYRNARWYGGDPARIVLAGHSAGAHLVTLLVTDAGYLKDPRLQLPAEAPASVRGVVAVSGIYRIPAADEFKGMAGRIVESLTGRLAPRFTPRALAPALLGAGSLLNPFALVFGRDPEGLKKASPLSHVRAGLPPFFLLVAEREVPGLAVMADDFAAALRKQGVPVELKEVEGCSHRTIVDRLHSGRCESARGVVQFIQRHAGQGRGT